MNKRTILCLLLLICVIAWASCLVLQPTGLIFWVATSAVQTFSFITAMVSVAHPPGPPWGAGFVSDQDLHTHNMNYNDAGMDIIEVTKQARLLN